MNFFHDFWYILQWLESQLIRKMDTSICATDWCNKQCEWWQKSDVFGEVKFIIVSVCVYPGQTLSIGSVKYGRVVNLILHFSISKKYNNKWFLDETAVCSWAGLLRYAIIDQCNYFSVLQIFLRTKYLVLHVGGDSSQAMVLVLAQAWKWTLTPPQPPSGRLSLLTSPCPALCLRPNTQSSLSCWRIFTDVSQGLCLCRRQLTSLSYR